MTYRGLYVVREPLVPPNGQSWSGRLTATHENRLRSSIHPPAPCVRGVGRSWSKKLPQSGKFVRNRAFCAYIPERHHGAPGTSEVRYFRGWEQTGDASVSIVGVE